MSPRQTAPGGDRATHNARQNAKNTPFGFFAPVLRASARSLLAVLMLVFAGCFARNHPVKEHIVYEGPTEPISTVVQKINQNNQRISTLWGTGNFDCWVRDDKGKTHHFGGDNLLLAYRKPTDLRLVGQQTGIGRMFDVGSNSDRYWLWIPMEIDTMWWGDYANAAASNFGGIPIRPDLLAEVLGVNNINPDLRRQPLPVMRFNNDQDAYMITFNVMLPDRMIVQKEVWYDRQTFLPRLVTFFDDNGRIVLRAYLTEHQHLNNDPSAPQVATNYDLYFLQTGTKLVFKLREVKESNKNVPNDRTFRFPGEDAAGKTYRVDQSTPPQ
jgi:hypothetical protein